MTKITSPLTLLFGFATVLTPNVSSARPWLKQFSEAPADGETAVIATQIRKQGFSCDKPISSERDRQRSKPDTAVWVLKCVTGMYRVYLVPKRAAKVYRIE
jgi:hypothetical protein